MAEQSRLVIISTHRRRKFHRCNRCATCARIEPLLPAFDDLVTESVRLVWPTTGSNVYFVNVFLYGWLPTFGSPRLGSRHPAFIALGRGKRCMITFIAGVYKRVNPLLSNRSRSIDIAALTDGDPQPSAGCVDSQTPETCPPTVEQPVMTAFASFCQGRHNVGLFVDTSGLPS